MERRGVTAPRTKEWIAAALLARHGRTYCDELERRFLKEFKGIGEVGADIFCREVQSVWDELFPFADARALAAAAHLGLPAAAGELAALVDRRDFPRRNARPQAPAGGGDP